MTNGTTQDPVIEQMALLLTRPGGRPTSPIVETSTDEAEAFGAQKCATRQVIPNASDLAYYWPELHGLGTDVSIDRIGTLGLSQAGQASWTLSRDGAPDTSFYAPETATVDQLLAWATLTVTALDRGNPANRDRS